jgi:predicted nucleic acid-binding protein
VDVAAKLTSKGQHFAEAQLVAGAEASGVGRVLSFDRALKRAASIEWWEP